MNTKKTLALVFIGMMVFTLAIGIADAKPSRDRCYNYYTINPNTMKCEFVTYSCLNLIWMGEYPLFMSMRECKQYLKN